MTNVSTVLSVYHIHSSAVSAQASFLVSWQDKYASHSIALMLTNVTKNKKERKKKVQTKEEETAGKLLLAVHFLTRSKS